MNPRVSSWIIRESKVSKDSDKDSLCKSKEYPVGHISQRQDGKYRKVSEEEWEKLPNQGFRSELEPSATKQHPSRMIRSTFPDSDKYIYPILSKLPDSHFNYVGGNWFLSRPVSIHDGDDEGIAASAPDDYEADVKAIMSFPSTAAFYIPGKHFLAISNRVLDQKFIDKHYPYLGHKDHAVQRIMLHEYAHHYDYMILSEENRKELNSLFDAMNSRVYEKESEDAWKEYAVSSYSLSLPNEYFAECYSAYVVDGKQLKQVDPDVYDWLRKKVFEGKEYE